MNKKSVYLLLAILFLVALISFYVSRQALKTTITPKEEKLQEEIPSEIAVEPPQQQVSIPTPVSAVGIAIIRKPQSQVESETAQQEAEQRKAAKRAAIASSATGGVEESTSETAPGPVNIKNRPTPEKIKELNSRGIIIY
ncbi:MAG: hypothetical protein ABSB18_07790 [Candidatus Omnitrophota bacterium]